MINREKIINALNICLGHGKCKDCRYTNAGGGYSTMDCRKQMMQDALELLKEQEATIKAQQFVLNNACEKLKEQRVAIKPKNIDKVGGNCPVCGLRMARTNKYCYQCGQEIDWND